MGVRAFDIEDGDVFCFVRGASGAHAFKGGASLALDGGGAAATPDSDSFVPVVISSESEANGIAIVWNFGQRPFEHELPAAATPILATLPDSADAGRGLGAEKYGFMLFAGSASRVLHGMGLESQRDRARVAELVTSRGDREDGLSPEADPKRNPLYTTADDAAAPAKAVSSSETVVSFMPRADALLAPPGQEKALVVPVSRVVANGLRMVAQHAAQSALARLLSVDASDLGLANFGGKTAFPQRPRGGARVPRRAELVVVVRDDGRAEAPQEHGRAPGELRHRSRAHARLASVSRILVLLRRALNTSRPRDSSRREG